MSTPKKTPAKPVTHKVAEPEKITTVGGVDPNAPRKPDWQLAANPSPEEQRAQSEALAREIAARNK